MFVDVAAPSTWSRRRDSLCVRNRREKRIFSIRPHPSVCAWAMCVLVFGLLHYVCDKWKVQVDVSATSVVQIQHFCMWWCVHTWHAHVNVCVPKATHYICSIYILGIAQATSGARLYKNRSGTICYRIECVHLAYIHTLCVLWISLQLYLICGSQPASNVLDVIG